MLLFSLLRAFFLPLAVAALSSLLTWSGCSAREQLPVSSHDTVTVRQQEGEGFLLAELEEAAIHRGDLILVNRETPFRFLQEQTLINVSDHKSGSYFIRSTDLLLTADTLNAVNAMLDDFLAWGGSKTVNLVAGWRSEETQQHLFTQSTQRNGLSHARQYVAPPGCSEHHTGLAADFSLYFADGTSADFTGEGEYAWIRDNCPRYGLILRYPEEKDTVTGIAYEPWHFRYVGIPHAEKMAELGFCLEEYIDYLRTFPYNGEHLFIDCGAERYEIWFEQGSDVHLPIEGEYTVSGNNVDGLIVTRKLLDGDIAPEYTDTDTIP